MDAQLVSHYLATFFYIYTGHLFNFNAVCFTKTVTIIRDGEDDLTAFQGYHFGGFKHPHLLALLHHCKMSIKHSASWQRCGEGTH